MLSRLYTLFLVLLVACSAWEAFGVAGLFVAAGVLGLAVGARFRATLKPLARYAVLGLSLLCLIAPLQPAIIAARNIALHLQCVSGLQQIGLALRNYHSAFGHFPPPCTFDDAGQPMHSWRVLIVTFLYSDDAQYRRYDLKQPWNAPKNKVFPDGFNFAFTGPVDYAAGTPASKATRYVALVGRRAVWRQDNGKTPAADNAKNRSLNTFIVTELADSGIQWTEPRDVASDDAAAIRALLAKAPHAWDNGYFFHSKPAVNAVLVDGDICVMLEPASAAVAIEHLLPEARSGNEYDDLRATSPEPNWPHCIGLPVWLVSAGLLLHQAVRSRKRPGNLVVPQER